MSDNAIMELYQVNAMINAMEALAFNHENGESDQTLVDIKLLCRTTRKTLENALGTLQQG